MGALLPSEGNQTALSWQEKRLLQDDVQRYTVLHLRKILPAEITLQIVAFDLLYWLNGG